MDNFLYALKDSNIFIPSAALIVIVLLVWAQLSGRGDSHNLDRDFNLVCGIAWTYAAIFFTLIATAIFIVAKSPSVTDEPIEWAKGFLILSFLMTVFNVALAIGLIAIKILRNLPFGESITKVGKDCGKRVKWILFWVFALVSLFVISLSVIGILARYCLYIGIAVFVVDNLYAAIMIWKTRNKHNKRYKRESTNKELVS